MPLLDSTSDQLVISLLFTAHSAWDHYERQLLCSPTQPWNLLSCCGEQRKSITVHVLTSPWRQSVQIEETIGQVVFIRARGNSRLHNWLQQKNTWRLRSHKQVVVVVVFSWSLSNYSEQTSLFLSFLSWKMSGTQLTWQKKKGFTSSWKGLLPC